MYGLYARKIIVNILITGGNGYIAKSLKQGLSSSCKTTTITRNDFDLTDHYNTCKWFENHQYDVVIHTAAVGGTRLQPDTKSVLDNNVIMYKNLLHNKEKFKHLISFGSGAEIFNPNSYYGISKKTIASSIEQTPNFYNLRIFATFDENELDTRFIKANIIRYIKKEPMVIHTDKVMDFFYMKDLINLVDYYIQNNAPNKQINCSYSDKYTLSNIANIINELDTHKVPINIQNKNTLEFYCGVHNEFPIKTIGLIEGIKETYKALYENSINHRG